MQLTSIFLALTALATTSLAQTAGFDAFTNPITPGTVIPAGQPFTITWDPSPAPLDGKITIILLQGATNTTLQLGDAVATDIDGSTGTFTWTPLTTIPKFNLYGFKLELVATPTTFQFSTFFSISGLGGSSSAVGSASTSGTASSSGATSGAGTTITTTAHTVASTSTSVKIVTSSAPGSGGSGSAGTSSAGHFSNGTATTSTSTLVTTAAATTSGAASTSKISSVNAAATMGASGLAGAVVIAFGLLL